MKMLLSTIVLLPLALGAQENETDAPMTVERLHDLILEIGQDVVIRQNVVQFSIDDSLLICVTDSAADRMRVISPIALIEDLQPEQLLIALTANFHSVLDVRYAISEDAIYAAFMHPLSPLTEGEFASALRQIVSANLTFGSTYSSGGLFFPP